MGRTATRNVGPRRATVRALRLSPSVAITLALFFIMVGLVGPWLPDFQTYEAIFDTGGGHLALLGRDPGFVWLVQTLNLGLSYTAFRWALLTFVATLLLRSLSKFQRLSCHSLGASCVVALAPFILLKFGAQIREGLALIVWLWVVLTNSHRPQLFAFALLAAVSTSIHLAILPFWLLLAIFYWGDRSPKVSAALAVFLYASFVFIVSDISRLESELFAGLSDDRINPTIPTVLYWLIFPFIFATSIVVGDTARRSNLASPMPVRSLAFALRASLLGALIGFSIQIAVTGTDLLQKGTVADSMRLASLLLTLYCLFLAMTGRGKLAVAVGCFLIMDTVRIMVAA